METATVDRKDLLTLLGHAKRVASPKSNLPILRNCLLEANDGSLRVTATDLGTGIRDCVAADIGEAWATTADCRALWNAVNTLPGESVTLSIGEKSTLVLQAGRVTFRLPTLPAEEYPAIPEVSDARWTGIDAAALREHLPGVLSALSSDETRNVLCGMLLAATEGRAVITGTDSYRLHVARLGPIGGISERTVLLPGDAAQLLGKLLVGESGEVRVYSDEFQACLRLPSGLELFTRVIEGTYPTYSRVLNAPRLVGADFALGELTAALKLLRPIVKASEQKIVFTPNGRTVTLSADSVDTGTAEVTLDAQHDVPGFPPFGLNVDYLLDALAAQGKRAKTVSLLQADAELGPVFVLSPDRKDLSTVVMAMQV